MKRLSFLLTLGLGLPVLALSLAAPRPRLPRLPQPPKSAGPPACFAGEPPRGSTCSYSGCHTSFPVNSGSAQLLLDLGGAEGGYTFGQHYRIRIALTQAGLTRGGFQAIALQDNDSSVSPGSITLTQPLRTQRIDANQPHAEPGCLIQDKVWIEHTDMGIDDPVLDTLHWEFDWQAPATDVGSITFYVSSLEANADLDATGDYVYHTAQTINALSTSLPAPAPSLGLRLSPSPTQDQLLVEWLGEGAGRGEEIVVYDVAGRMALRSGWTSRLAVGGLAPGVYWVRARAGSLTAVQKFVKQ
jgi:hypothetical protein